MTPIYDLWEIHPSVMKMPEEVRKALSTATYEYWMACMECGESFKTSGDAICEKCRDKLAKFGKVRELQIPDLATE